ncbi:MAG: hypothetical protein ABIY35_00205, partial [Chitinophagaceae bacterium]
GSLDDFDYWYDSRYYGNNYYTFNNPYSFHNPYSYWGSGFNSPFSYWTTFSYSPWGYSPWGYSPYGFYSPYTTVVYYKNRNIYSGNVLNGNMNGYRNSLYSNNNSNYNLNTNKSSKRTFGDLFKGNFSREQNPNYTPPNGSRTQPVRTYEQQRPPVNNTNQGSRSGGYKSTGSNNTSSRPPRNN